ncbi:MAG: alpha/beta hydrolase-fold protein [Bacteroidota bacterium]
MNWKTWVARLALLSLAVFLAFVGRVYLLDQAQQGAKQTIMPNLKEHVSDQVQIWEDAVRIPYLDTTRTLRIYLPEGYKETDQRYPVIYMLDADALFNSFAMGRPGPEWQLDEVIDQVHQAGGPAAIVIGIDNSEARMTEYKPFIDQYRPEEAITGDQHARWIAEELKPWVDSTFRTQASSEHTTIGGASLGGLMAYYLLMTYPETFGNGLIFSASFWVNDIVYSLHETVNNLNQFKIFLHVGKKEGTMVRDARKVSKLLKAAGMDADHLRFELERGEDHWHMTWRKGFAKAYPWIIQR